MKLVEREFKRRGTHWYSGKIRVCGNTLPGIFKVPDTVTTIWVSLHDKPSSSRLVAKVCEDFSTGHYPALSFHDVRYGCPWFYTHPGADMLLKRFMGKTVHIQVDYT